MNSSRWEAPGRWASAIAIGLASFAFGAGAAWGAGPIPDDDGLIHGCFVEHRNDGESQGSVRLVSDPTLCRPGEVPVTWNIEGPMGPQGEPGPPGPQGPPGPPGEVPTPPVVYRWAVFDVASAAPFSIDWLLGNEPGWFGGVRPSDWVFGATAGRISPDKAIQRQLFTRRGYGAANANLHSEVYLSVDDGTLRLSTSRVFAALFRVRNTTDAIVPWPVAFVHTCATFGSGNRTRMASIALNGVDVWTSAGQRCGRSERLASVTLDIPSSRTSTVVFVSQASERGSVTGTVAEKTLVMAFRGASLALPPGLEFVDDLDTASGGYEQ